MSVSALLAAPAAAGLFHRAVVAERAAATPCSADVAADRAERIAAHLGVPCTRRALVAVPADRLVAAAGELTSAVGADAGLLHDPGGRRRAPAPAAASRRWPPGRRPGCRS